ncbi:hypothetical protein [Rubrivirga marina]|uniref:SRP54-type proteins GTP-binding domain-containing protein n=1 Tax=Rubrivirga marina TaxID=1196024 RepID=A0A271IZ23_9BACT|nr:hypothetical protein [Rubrivirga marina]PAP75749.1 hypothetical protein BSZ37_04495 [Rubrivirga marina]
MTLKTVTGPSIREALADARRLFGRDVVMLQSTPGAAGRPASVTVAFDDTPVAKPTPAARPASAPAPRPTPPPAVPEPVAKAAPRAYGYGAARNVRPKPTEPISAPAQPAGPALPAWTPLIAPSAPATEPGATAAEVAALRARLATLESALARLAPAAPTGPTPVVFVGPAGAGKTSLALRLALAPALAGASQPAALIVAPEGGHAPDAAPVFWAAGVPVAVVHTAEETAEALARFAETGADFVVVDTPALPLAADRARPVVARLGEVLAPLGRAEVHLAVDATRAPATLTAATVAALGLRPDALALTRLDEAPAAGDVWTDVLGLPLRFAASGSAPSDLARADHQTTRPAAPPPARSASPPPEPRRAAVAPDGRAVGLDLHSLVSTVLSESPARARPVSA